MSGLHVESEFATTNMPCMAFQMLTQDTSSPIPPYSMTPHGSTSQHLNLNVLAGDTIIIRTPAVPAHVRRELDASDVSLVVELATKSEPIATFLPVQTQVDKSLVEATR